MVIQPIRLPTLTNVHQRRQECVHVCGEFMYTVSGTRCAGVCVRQLPTVCGSGRTTAFVFLRQTVRMTRFSVLWSTGAK